MFTALDWGVAMKHASSYLTCQLRLNESPHPLGAQKNVMEGPRVETVVADGFRCCLVWRFDSLGCKV